jgi:hypothetical protein
MDDDVLDAEFAAHLRGVLERQKMGEADQLAVDGLILPCILMYNRDPVLQRLGWRELVTPRHLTFQAGMLPNIGACVRAMIVRQPAQHLQMLQLLRLSMPYIKHNRLAFFPFQDVHFDTLQSALRLQLATCLGLYSETSKKPVWRQRVQIVAMFLKLLTQGAPLDMHVFCRAHVPLLRLALVEYYIYFVSTNMPVEARLQHRLFGVEIDMRSVFRQIQVIIDNFRQAQFQGEADWDSVVTRAQAAVEKCNRSCKGTRPEPAPEPRAAASCTTSALVHAMPPFVPPASLLGDSATSLRMLLSARAVQRGLRTHPLPFNAAFEQSKRLRLAMQVDTKQTLNACFLYVCLKCVQHIPDKSMRLGPAGESAFRVVCSSCLGSADVVSVNLLGRVVSVGDRKFYLCRFCVQVHEWQGSGCELSGCARADAPRARTRSCVVCTNTASLSTLRVLDSQLGVMQSVTLCSRHTPYEHQMRFVHDLDALMQRIQQKFVRK